MKNVISLFKKNEENNEEEVKMGWSLKKKVLVGLGVVGAGVVGVIAYGMGNKEIEVNCEEQESEDEGYYDDEDEDQGSEKQDEEVKTEN